jgi:hypothetical protein
MSAFGPDIRVEKDYEGYFEALVRSWVDQKRHLRTANVSN